MQVLGELCIITRAALTIRDLQEKKHLCCYAMNVGVEGTNLILGHITTQIHCNILGF